jgi:hypothetical protein
MPHCLEEEEEEAGGGGRRMFILATPRECLLILHNNALSKTKNRVVV